MFEAGSFLTLANVGIYTVGRQWSPITVSGSDGKFTISGFCLGDLVLTARKEGYQSREPEYPFSNRGIIVMLKLGAYEDGPGYIIML